MFGKKGKETKQDKQEQARQRSNTAPTSSGKNGNSSHISLNDSAYDEKLADYELHSVQKKSAPDPQPQDDIYSDDRRGTVSKPSTVMETFGSFQIPSSESIKLPTELSLDNVHIIEVKPPVPAPTLKPIPETPPVVMTSSPKESKDATSSVPEKPRRLAPPLGPPPKDPPPLPGTQKKIEVKKTSDSASLAPVSGIPSAPPWPAHLLKNALLGAQPSQNVSGLV